MPNILSALLPHSPLLIEEIGKNNKQSLAQTNQAYQLIIEELRTKQVEAIFVISPHGPLLENSYGLGIAPQFQVSLAEFGCFKKRPSLTSAPLLADALLEFTTDHFPVQLVPQPNLDYGTAIPLELLTKEQKDIPVLPIFPADNLDWIKHYQFGEKLKEFIDNRSEKIAIIASGDLSHRLKVSSPGGFSPKGAKFDKKIIEYLNDPAKAKEKLLNLDLKNVAEAKECLLKPLLILLGIVGSNYRPKKLAYQTDFGIGYLSFLFKQD